MTSLFHKLNMSKQAHFKNNSELVSEGRSQSTCKNIADTIEIIKHDGQVLCSIKSHLSPNIGIDLEKVREQTISHYRKLPDPDASKVFQLLIQKSYAYYKNHRGIIIIVIAVTYYSLDVAEQTMAKITEAYDETVLDVFGQYNIPKNFGHREEKKMLLIKSKLRDILTEEVESGNSKGDKISTSSTISQEGVSRIQQRVERGEGIGKIEQKNDLILQKTMSLSQKLTKASFYEKSKKYLLWAMILLNMVMLAYLVPIPV